MLCTWGDIALEAGQVIGCNESFGPNYTEHALIGRKPKLQCTGDNLRTLELTLSLNYLRTGVPKTDEPSALLAKLNAAVDSHVPLPFSWGNGVYEGMFVGENISAAREMSDSRGLLMSAVYTLTLKEFADNQAASTSAPAVKSSASASMPTSAQQQSDNPAKVAGAPNSSSKASTAKQIVRQE